MSKQIKALCSFLFVLSWIIFSSCETEDPGPLQEVEKEFSVVDFDRLEMGSALNVRVEQSNTFSIQARGDRRNIDDLEVFKSGSTLIIKFDNTTNRRHETYITITMPRLAAVNFSGASVSKVKGFESDDDLDFYLSGASVCQLDAAYREVNLALSGASTLHMFGSGDKIRAEISGASALIAFDYPVQEATVNVSGASSAKVAVTDALEAIAGGASSVLYRGNPSVLSNVSGSSTIQKD
jgi:Putative auto-transporter adhesin, head GIN domain